MNSNEGMTISYATTQPADITIRDPVGTELMQEKCVRNKVKLAA
jgi:hypothetical protein